MTAGSSSRLPALLAALRLQLPGLPRAASHCLAALHLSARQLASEAGAAAAQEAAASSGPEAAAKPPARRRRQAATPAPRKPLAPRTLERLERDAMVATFAVKMGLKSTDGSAEALEQDPSQPAPGAAAAGAATEHPPHSVDAWAAGELDGRAGPAAVTRAEAEEQQAKREERRKRQPPTFPSYEVFDRWLAEHEQQLQPLRRYLAQELGMPRPESTIAMLFRQGPGARDLMLPERQPLVIPLEEEAPLEGDKKGKKRRAKKGAAAAEAPAAPAGEAGEAAAAVTDPGEGKPKKKRGRKKRGEEEVGAEQLSAAGAAELLAGEEAALAAEQQQGQQGQALPRLARIAAEWHALLQEAGLLPAGGLKELAVPCPKLLVDPPPGGRQETLARLAEMQELLGWGHAEVADLVRRAPNLLFADTADILRRLEFLRLHAHVAGAEGGAALRLLPTLLWASERQLMETVRVLVQYSRSMSSYTSLVRWHPHLLLAATRRRAMVMEDTLRALLPPEFDPASVIKSWPLLLSSPPRALRKRWGELEELCSRLPAWREDLDALLAVPGAAQQAQQQQRGEGPAAEGGDKAAAQSKGSRRSRRERTGPTREQYHTLARLLELKPEQRARLEFLLEMHPEAAAEGDEPLVGLVTMRPRAFERKYPGLAEWLQQRREQAEAEREQRQAEREQRQAEEQQQLQGVDAGGEGWPGTEAPVSAEPSVPQTTRRRGRPKAGNAPAAAAGAAAAGAAAAPEPSAATSRGDGDASSGSDSDSDSDSSTDGSGSSSGSSSSSESGGEEGGPPVRAAPQKRVRRGRKAAAAAAAEPEAAGGGGTAAAASQQKEKAEGATAPQVAASRRLAAKGSGEGSGKRGRKKKEEKQAEQGDAELS